MAQLVNVNEVSMACLAHKNKCIIPMRKKNNSLWLFVPTNLKVNGKLGKIDPTDGWNMGTHTYSVPNKGIHQVIILKKTFKKYGDFMMSSKLWDYYAARSFGISETDFNRNVWKTRSGITVKAGTKLAKYLCYFEDEYSNTYISRNLIKEMKNMRKKLEKNSERNAHKHDQFTRIIKL